jgi:hypothetical protein
MKMTMPQRPIAQCCYIDAAILAQADRTYKVSLVRQAIVSLEGIVAAKILFNMSSYQTILEISL